MDQPYEKNIDLYEEGIQLNQQGEVVHHPLEDLYYWIPGREPFNRNYLTFAGEDLYKSRNLDDLKNLSIEFEGEPYEEMDREAWADPLRVDILSRLLDQGRSWYLSFLGDYTEQLLKQDGRSVPDTILEYFSRKGSAQLLVLDSREPYGFGKGLLKKLFFEVPKDEIEWVVNNIWPHAYQGYPIEGYNLESGKIDMLKKWNERKKDESLFREVIDETFAVFYTYPEEQRHFAFFTSARNSTEFRQKIGIEELKKQAQKL